MNKSGVVIEDGDFIGTLHKLAQKDPREFMRLAYNYVKGPIHRSDTEKVEDAIAKRVKSKAFEIIKISGQIERISDILNKVDRFLQQDNYLDKIIDEVLVAEGITDEKQVEAIKAHIKNPVESVWFILCLRFQ